MVTLISKSPEETLAIGEAWGRSVERGSVIGLSGDLGAGKTQLVKGIARGLGCTSRVHSPTFALLNEYGGGRERLFHLDLYRLDHRDDVLSAGLDEYLSNPDGVTVVEWIERWLEPSGRGAARPQGTTRLVRIETISETERRICYDDPGA